MYSTYLLFDPVSSVGTVVMTNQGGEFTYNYGIPPMIFGEVGAMSAEEGRSDTSKIQGLYYNARTILNGIGKMYTVLNIQPYISDGDINLNSSIPGMLKRQGRQIGPNTFVVTTESGPLKMVSIERYSDINGIKRLSAPYGQSIEAVGDVWALAIGMVLLIIAALWSMVVILSSLISFIIRKAKKRASKYDFFKKYDIVLSTFILLLVVDIALVVNKMMSVAPRSSLIINIIASIILAIAPIVYAIQLYRNWTKLTCGKLQKVSHIISMCMGFAMTYIVIVMEMYRF